MMGDFFTKIGSISGLIKSKKKKKKKKNPEDTANESYNTALKKLLIWEGVILSHNV